MPDVKFSNQYPYTDFHELNLDWVIKEVKYWSERVGKSIQKIELTGTVGLVDTYTITYSDGTTSTFDVTNGNGIASVAKTGTVGLVDTYTITFQDGSTSTFEVTNGAAAVDPTLSLSDYAADAEQTGNRVSKIESAFHNNLMEYDNIVIGGYFNGNGVVASRLGSSYCAGYIPIDSNKTYKITEPDAGTLQICTYNSNKEFIERAYNNIIPEIITFGSAVRFVRISHYDGTLNDIIFATSDDYDFVSVAKPFVLDGKNISPGINGDNINEGSIDESKTSFFTRTNNILNPDACEKDKFIDSSMGIITQATSEISHAIEVKQGDVVNFTSMNSLYLAKWEEDDSYVRTALSSSDSTYTVLTDGYIRFARFHEYFDDNFMVCINHNLPSEFEPYGSYSFNYFEDKEIFVGQISKTSTVITVDIRNFRFLVKKYNNSAIRAYLWRTNNCQVKDENGVYHNVWYDSDSDGVVRISGEDDFIGGYHGDETQTVFKIFVDGAEYNENSTFDNIEFNEVVLYFESNVYHCNTSGTPNVIAFKRNKIIKFNSDGYVVQNYWTAQENVTLDNAYLGMLSVQHYLEDYVTVLLKGFIGNNDYAFKDAGDTISNSSKLTDTEYITAYGHIGIKMEDFYPNEHYVGSVVEYSGQHRNKTYFNLIDGSAHGAMQIGDTLHATAITYLK